MWPLIATGRLGWHAAGPSALRLPSSTLSSRKAAVHRFAHPMLTSSCGMLQEVTDLMGYLLRNRIIFIGSRIGDDVSVPTACSSQSVLSPCMPP